MAYEYTGPMAEPARFKAEGGQSMPRVRKPATPTEVKVRKLYIAWRRIDFFLQFSTESPSMKFTRIHDFSTLRYGCAGHIGGSLRQRHPCRWPR